MSERQQACCYNGEWKNNNNSMMGENETRRGWACSVASGVWNTRGRMARVRGGAGQIRRLSCLAPALRERLLERASYAFLFVMCGDRGERSARAGKHSSLSRPCVVNNRHVTRLPRFSSALCCYTRIRSRRHRLPSACCPASAQHWSHVVSPRQIAAKRTALRNTNALQKSSRPLFRGIRWRGSIWLLGQISASGPPSSTLSASYLDCQWLPCIRPYLWKAPKKKGS